jgi:hypothetical protein
VIGLAELEIDPVQLNDYKAALFIGEDAVYNGIHP